MELEVQKFSVMIRQFYLKDVIIKLIFCFMIIEFLVI